MEKLYPSIGKPDQLKVPSAEDANSNRLFSVPDLRGVTGQPSGYTGAAFKAAKPSFLLNNGITGLATLPSMTTAQGLTGFLGGAGYVNIEYVDADGVKQTGTIPFFKGAV